MTVKIDSDYPQQDIKVPEESAPSTGIGYKIPTEIIELPSRGLIYPKDNPLSSGEIELKYMTAKEEDILTTESYIKRNVVIDKLLESLIVTPNVKIDDIVVGDLNAIVVAARIFGYGSDYMVTVETPSGKKQSQTIDLSKLELIYLQEDYVKTKGVNEFSFILPNSGAEIVFRLLTTKDTKEAEAKMAKNSKMYGGQSKTYSTLLSYQILSVNGVTDKKEIFQFIEEGMRVADSRALRNHISEIQPNIDMSQEVADRETGETFRAEVTVGLQFLYPDFKL